MHREGREHEHQTSYHQTCYTISMKKLALKMTPQRSTQYASMIAELAEPELATSPLGDLLQGVCKITLAGQQYLLANLADETAITQEIQAVLGRLGAINEAYEYFTSIGDVAGPFLRPIEPHFTPFVPTTMAEARRYKGKTNEIFTHVLLNTALFAGEYRHRYRDRLRILDPLCGGGTTLFLALVYGYDAFGIELDRQDIDTTAVFIRQYLEGEHIRYKEIDERGRRAGRRHQFDIGPKGDTRQLVLIHGNTIEARIHLRDVTGGPHMHAIVGDLPYGIQHVGEISTLLSQALPIWEELLLPGGTLALAWNATRIRRAEMIGLLEAYTQLQVRNVPPYTDFAHTVDRVIKKRDIVVGVKI
jgi:SAM-dependent methyltransferase